MYNVSVRIKSRFPPFLWAPGLRLPFGGVHSDDEKPEAQRQFRKPRRQHDIRKKLCRHRGRSDVCENIGQIAEASDGQQQADDAGEKRRAENEVARDETMK